MSEIGDVMLETGDLILETGDLILATGGFLRQLILQSLHPLLHVVSLLKEFPARLIPIGGPPTGLSVICTREGASQHGLGDVVDSSFHATRARPYPMKSTSSSS